MSQSNSIFPFNWLEQTINPVTTWFSPNVEFNFAGDKPLEDKINAEVASYGKQLGILTEALLALAKDSPLDEIQRLQQLHKDIDSLKKRQQGKLQARIEADLDRLQQQDPAAYQAILRKRANP